MTNGIKPEQPESVESLMHGQVAARELSNDSTRDVAVCESDVREDIDSESNAAPSGESATDRARDVRSVMDDDGHTSLTVLQSTT